MNCEVGKNQRGIKRVPRRKEKVCSYKKSEKGFHLIPEKTAVSKVVFWKMQEGKNRERGRSPNPCGKCGKQTEGKADSRLYAPRRRVRTSESRVENTAQDRETGKEF